MDGRPLWEPPVLRYHELIGEEYEQRRKSYLKYTNDDVVRTTEMMGASIEFDLLQLYLDWADHNVEDALGCHDDKGEAFLQALTRDIFTGPNDVSDD